MNSRSIRMAVAAGALLCTLVRGAPAVAQSFFRDGDTWVLSGDSITYIGLYRQTVKDVLDHFHPGNSVTVVDTAKWGQLTAEAEGKGLERKPAVVTIMLGMNNVIHHDYPVVHDFTKGAKAYAENLRRQVRKYKKCGAEVVLMAPTLSDSTENSYFSPWNTEQGLRVYGEAVRRLCDEEMCRFVPVAAEFEEAKKDLCNNARPELKAYPDSLDRYDTIILAYPNYWGTMPMAVFTFLERYDFSGKTILPLCTNEGSGMGKSERDIEKLAKGANVKKGLPITGSNANGCKKSVHRWLAANGLM